MHLWNYKGEKETITEALRVSIPEHAVICLTGSGGKTTLLFAWACEIASSGKSVIVTTTTHMANPGSASQDAGDPQAAAAPWDGIPVLYTENSSADSVLADITRVLNETGIAMVVSTDPERPDKVTSPSADVMDQLSELADAVLIEADGSRRMPLKWPAPWEPVVPDDTDITVCVAGLSSLGRRPEDAMYRYDELPEAFRRDTVNESFISSVLASPDGGQKGTRGEFRVYLNQADDQELQNSASRIQQILGLYGIQSAWGTLLRHISEA